MIVRDARPEELAEIGEIRVSAYRADGFLSDGSGYAPTLRALGTAGEGPVLVAVADDDARQILGTVMLQPWPHGGHVVTGPDEAEVRALAVVPDGQGRGTGLALLRAVIERAVQTGVRHLVLLTQPEMQTAQRMYRRAGFVRLPDRDWSPQPGIILLAYGLVLAPIEQAPADCAPADCAPADCAPADCAPADCAPGGQAPGLSADGG